MNAYQYGPYEPPYADPPAYGPPARRPRRGRVLGWTALVAAVGMAVVLGITGYRVLDSIDIVSLDPFGPALGWLLLCGIASAGALIAFLLAIGAISYTRPKGVAWGALTASVVLPIVAVIAAGYFGVGALRQHVTADLADGAVAADALVAALDAADIDAGPLRELLLLLADSG